MPYRRNIELPEGVKDNLPEHGQDIYRAAFNSAIEDYQDPDKRRDKSKDAETVAHKVAWAAVKKEYTKRGERWVKKGD